MDRKVPLPVVLVSFRDYPAQVGQVAELADDHLAWISGLEKIKEPPYGKGKVESVPLSDVNAVAYRSIFGVTGILGGILSVCLGAALVAAMVAGGVINFWLIGAAPVLVLAGLAFIIGCRRHRLVFSCKDREIPWTSGALEYKASHSKVADVLRWATERRVSTTDFPDRMTLLRKSLGT